VSRAFVLCALLAVGSPGPAQDAAPKPVDFTREVQPLLANHCLLCHGPDSKARKADLRLDSFEGATAALDEGRRAIVPGDPARSEILKRVTAADPDDVMPPVKTGKKLSPAQIDVLRRWIVGGARYEKHWAFVKPARPAVPAVKNSAWPKNDLDRFILARLEQAGLAPAPEADRWALARRLSIDLIGLPPPVEEADRFAADRSTDAVEKYVDRLLASPSFGERWARVWLDLARYADSQGYAEDRPRVIWPWRDWVIRALNENKPFDRFTIEQLAGDLLPGATEEQRIATGFHRNTLTNTEGGTDDEEFRNAAIVDRVSTTMQVWMGLTMACTQCHDHKYDPLSQEEFFRLFAVLNQTEDADRPDDSPFVSLYSAEQKDFLAKAADEIAALEKQIAKADLDAPRRAWETALAKPPAWGEAVEGPATELRLPAASAPVTALRLEVPEQPAFKFTKLEVSLVPPGAGATPARFVRVELPGKARFLHLAEVQVFAGGANVALQGKASQSSTDFDGPAKLANDGNTNGDFNAKSVSHTKLEDDPWWELDLGSAAPVERVVVWNRTDGGDAIQSRTAGLRVKLLDEKRKPVGERRFEDHPKPSSEWRPDGHAPLAIRSAHPDEGKIQVGGDPKKAAPWAPSAGKPHRTVFVLDRPAKAGGELRVRVEATGLGRVRLSASTDPQAPAHAELPAEVAASLRKAAAERTKEESARIADHHRATAAELEPQRRRIAELRKQVEGTKPAGTSPVLRELGEGKRRRTQIQIRGNFLDKGKEVSEGVPAILHPLPADAPRNRLGLAAWLVHPENPLTARVVANRHWEQLFGTGLVATSDDFGVRGEPPSHPELLDWLATELVRSGWDVKALLRLMVTSATYRQASRTTPEQAKKDPTNRLLSVGPRQRLSAEQVRDQALFASGLLSPKMFGPSVYPPRPKLGLSAAFSSSTDWEDSKGEDRWRRAVYTFWRRSMPYPSMATFDAPSCEVTTLRRIATNTPLQALVTLNDPVYVEAAQALARRIAAEGGPDARSKAAWGFRRCLTRPPRPAEVERLAALYEQSKETYAKDPAKAKSMSTEPLGPLPQGADAAELAAWSVVSNVLLNLDEIFLKR
jgi:hypothetical protein